MLPDAESELPPIELQLGVGLRLNLRPGRAPSGQRWQIELLRLGEAPGHLEEFAGGTADGEGVWSRAGLPPDDYILRIREGPETVWYRGELMLPPGAEPISHEVRLPVDTLAGQVFLGSEPVAAKLYFGGYHGAVRLPAESDEEGLFEVRVPERESWTVDVYTKDTDAGQRFSDLVPEPADGAGKRWLELVIPDTLVEGRVVDVDGEPVEDARVRMNGSKGGLTRRSRPDGTVELRGLRPGDYWLQATTLDPPRQSEIQRLTLDEDGSLEAAELVVRAPGRVSTPGVLSVPMLEPGYYLACRDLEYELQMTGARPSGADRRCAEGLLAPFGELELTIPPAE